jgi:PKD repeat protein
MSMPQEDGEIWLMQRPVRQRSSVQRIALLSIAAFGLACGSDDRAEVGTAAPIASFTADQTTGPPGTTIAFSDTSTGDITGRSWDFGALGSSTEQNPVITFPVSGNYPVGLSVSGPKGTSSVMEPAFVEIGDPPVASFSCIPLLGFAPLTINCIDGSTGADEILWDFGDGSTSDLRDVQHIYTSMGSYTLEQTASSAGGTDSLSAIIEVLPFAITANPPSGSAPVDVLLTAQTGGLGGFQIWIIDNALAGTAATILHRFKTPGTFTVELIFRDLGSDLVGVQSIEYVVGYGPASAAFIPSVSGGSGPLPVVFMDDSAGAIDSWQWDFGDGNQCIFPADPNSLLLTCDSSSPSHTYESIGHYDVALSITGPAEDPNDPPILSATTVIDAVRVFIVDPSFELQTANQEIGGDWIHLRPDDALEIAEHIALSAPSNTSPQADGGMPTDGSKWAVLDGLGTDGLTAVDVIENGIRQDFFRPSDRPVLEFDYALLYSEPPASLVLDAVTATVSDGLTTVDIPSAQANVSSPYAGTSVRFPMRDGSTVRITPILTASINLIDAFPTATDETLFTLTFRTSNLVNEFRSPRAYVDNIRFVEPETTLSAQFSLGTNPVVVGQAAEFTDESCLDPQSGNCVLPTSLRWDFDTQLLANPPPASGSREPAPNYIFTEARVYNVKMVARLADLQSEASLLVTVIDGPMASFSFTPEEGPYVAPATLIFSDQSKSDASDPITSWSWDFGGFGTSTLENPAPVEILQAGPLVIRLTITTASDETDTFQSTVTVE